MSFAQELIEMGRQEVRKESKILAEQLKKSQAMIESSRIANQELLVNMLKEKFGFLPSSYQTMIENSSTNQILNWCKKLLHAKNLQEIFEEIEKIKV